MKQHALFSSKDKSKTNLKCRLLRFLFGALRVKVSYVSRNALSPYCLQISCKYQKSWHILITLPASQYELETNDFLPT